MRCHHVDLTSSLVMASILVMVASSFSFYGIQRGLGGSSGAVRGGIVRLVDPFVECFQKILRSQLDTLDHCKSPTYLGETESSSLGLRVVAHS